MSDKILLAVDAGSLALRLQALLQRRNLRVWVAGKIAEVFSYITSDGPFELIVLGPTVDGLPAQSVLDSLRRMHRVEDSSVLMIESSFSALDDMFGEKLRRLARLLIKLT
jgi:DNA-binding response OmpR family regulator